MQMIDSGTMDDKIIAVAAKDPSVNHITKMEELPNHFLLELRNFFEQYKVLENKKVEIDNFQDKATACRIIEEAIAFYKKNFKKVISGQQSKTYYDNTTDHNSPVDRTGSRHAERTGGCGWRHRYGAGAGFLHGLYATPGAGYFIGRTYSAGGDHRIHYLLLPVPETGNTH
jgi:hypothetical protein